jgi:hypothetical protein
MKQGGEPKVVFIGTEPVAQVVKGRLEAAGFQAYCWGGNIGGEMPLGDQGIAGFGAVKVVVAEEDYAAAKALLHF